MCGDPAADGGTAGLVRELTAPRTTAVPSARLTACRADAPPATTTTAAATAAARWSHLGRRARGGLGTTVPVPGAGEGSAPSGSPAAPDSGPGATRRRALPLRPPAVRGPRAA